MMKTTSIIGLNLLSLLLLATSSYATILNTRSILSKDTAWVANNNTCDKKRQSAEYYYRLSMSAIEESTKIYCLDKAIKVNPKHFKAYDRRRNAKRTIGDLKSAIVDYDMALKINPKFGHSYYNRAVAKAEIKDKKGAIADYTKAIEIFTRNKQIYEMEMATKNLAELQVEN